MKMKFTVEQYRRDCLKHEVPLNTYGAEWYKVIDGWEFEFEGDSRTAYKNGFAVSKDWCVPVEEKTACEMFKALGFAFRFSDDMTFIEYVREDNKGVTFIRYSKTFQAFDYAKQYALEIDGELLKAIVKQFEELGW